MTAVDPGEARRIVSRFGGRRVVVAGDVMLDRFIWGDVDRISPEAPVPVVRVARESVHLGGAANVAANLAALGARVSLVGLVGEDAAADQLRAAIEASGIESALVASAGRATTVKTRIIARAQQVVRVDREHSDPALPEELSALEARLGERLEGAAALVVSDYDKGAAAGALLASVLPEARRKGVPAVVDPKRLDFSVYQPATVVTPNQAELGRAASVEIRSDEDCLGAARSVLDRIDVGAVLVTRGERGMLLVERGRSPFAVPAFAREVYDVTGAGDTVVAVLALALASGASLPAAAVLANHAAGIVVGKVGTATVSAQELLARVDEHPPLRSAHSLTR